MHCMNLFRGSRMLPCMLILAMTGFLAVPVSVLADIGVGVGAGKIVLQKSLEPGSGYELPLLPVLNTGDEPGEYEVTVQFNEAQPELKPDAKWFRFSPTTFYLEPQQSAMVRTTLVVPISAKPGNYFVYLEAHPVKKGVMGQSSVGIAAAAKLYFTVAPSNLLQGMYYRSLSFLSTYAPWTYVIGGVFLFAIIITLFRRLFSFNVGISLKKRQ